MNRIPVFFRPELVAPDQGASPSAHMPAQVVADWQAHGLPIEVIAPPPVSRGQLALAHDRDYVDAVLDGREENGFGNRSAAVARSLPHTSGAMLAAAHLITAITPHSFSFLITFNVVVMLVVGGMGSISGSVIGATLMTLVPEFLRRLETAFSLGGHPLYGLSQIIIAVTITLVMIFRRQGLMGGREITLPRILGPRDLDAGGQTERSNGAEIV